MDRETLATEITAAMRAHDKPRLSILRLVKNEIDIKEKESKREATAEEVTAALKKVLKQTGETLEGSIKAGTNAERTELLQLQVDILSAYLPAQVEGDALLAVIDEVLAENAITEKRDMGRVIGLVVAATGGNVDKAEVARIVGSRLA
ncbi:MAG: glutamyl-tRNA amidotransferase [Actinobacteria bacterium]|nr:MAG: glutamyl-tRNA amidotransferase [Actinomycetota bacterium]